MLKKTVPTSCTIVAHQSIWRGDQSNQRASPRRVTAVVSGPAGASSTSLYCRYAALVKKIEPTKNVHAATLGSTLSK